MFLNVKLQKPWQPHHLQCIISSKDSENQEECLCERDEAEGQNWMLVIFGPSGGTALNSHDSLLDITACAQEHFQESQSVKSVRHVIYKCELKLYQAKKKPNVNTIQKRSCLLWAKAHLKWSEAKCKTVLWSDESKYKILFGNHRHHVLQTKEKREHLACYQWTV